MDTIALEKDVAAPIQVIGMSYYFDPATSEHAKQHGLNVYEFYGLGRGGVMGSVDAKQVGDAFWFFHQNAIDNLWNSASSKVSADKGASEHLQAAYNFAERVFANVPDATLKGFADAAQKVIAAVPTGRYALVDGYRKFPVPSEPVRAAYLSSILLRELRGAVHIYTTREFNIAPNEACYVTNAMIFTLHGYSDADAPDVTPDLESRMEQAEAKTTEMMAGYLEVLSNDERAAFAKGVAAMDDAIKNPPGSTAQ